MTSNLACEILYLKSPVTPARRNRTSTYQCNHFASNIPYPPIPHSVNLSRHSHNETHSLIPASISKAISSSSISFQITSTDLPVRRGERGGNSQRFPTTSFSPKHACTVSQYEHCLIPYHIGVPSSYSHFHTHGITILGHSTRHLGWLQGFVYVCMYVNSLVL